LSDTKYIRNEEGGIHSVTSEHYDKHLTETTAAGNVFMLPGYKEITEKEAKAAHPQLFGIADPQITFTDDELVRAATRKKLLAELYAE
jgi:hypothetical protein